MTARLSFDEIVAVLVDRVPEFLDEHTKDQEPIRPDRQYLIFGDFARFLRKRLSRNGADDQVVRKGFDLLNEMCLEPHSELANLAVVSVFEALADEPDHAVAAKALLSGPAVELFDKVLAG